MVGTCYPVPGILNLDNFGLLKSTTKSTAARICVLVVLFNRDLDSCSFRGLGGYGFTIGCRRGYHFTIACVLAESFLQVIEPRDAYAGHLRPKLLPVRWSPFWPFCMHELNTPWNTLRYPDSCSPTLAGAIARATMATML